MYRAKKDRRPDAPTNPGGEVTWAEAHEEDIGRKESVSAPPKDGQWAFPSFPTEYRKSLFTKDLWFNLVQAEDADPIRPANGAQITR